MILVEAGRRDDRAFDAKIIFAGQLAAAGHKVVIDDETVPEKIDRNQKYEVAPFLVDLDDVAITRVLLIGAEDIAEETLFRLRALHLGTEVRVSAIGRFPDHQSRLGARSRIAYAIGREPDVLDLAQLQKNALPVAAVSPLVAPGIPPAAREGVAPGLFVFLPPEWLDDPMTLSTLAVIDNLPQFRLSVVVAGKGKETIKRSRYSGLSVFGIGELGPSILARRADILAFFGEGVPGERMAILALELMASGKAVIDCTAGSAFIENGAPVLRGPADLGALPNYLEHTVLVNLAAIGRHSRESSWVASRSISRLEQALALAAPSSAPATQADGEGHTFFFPTNGNGLGHAQRCSLIAAEMSRRDRTAFAAFPSCVPLLQAKGFPCLPLVPKSNDHPEDFANDIVTYLRLRRTVGSADHLVFDGGYVFDSVFRIIRETGCRGTWVRRGLWRPGQVAEMQIEREQAFGQVIVPGEAFEELNADYSFASHIRRVGPIVQTASGASRADLRARLETHFDTRIEQLVVTMLGGGVAADRSAQMQSLCAMLEPRKGCLHLVVVWPNSRIAPGLFGWKRSKVVTTLSSLSLAVAADLVVSAAGYNSFHELLYHRVPTIFIPQVAPFMDDQERRAQAASDRGLADTVLAHEFMQLERSVRHFLDGPRAAEVHSALAETTLPDRGIAAAAALIEEGGGP